jgi:hypothetical protein
MKGNFAGHEKEPPSKHGGGKGGKHPPIHSHSARPKRHLKTGRKRGGM